MARPSLANKLARIVWAVLARDDCYQTAATGWQTRSTRATGRQAFGSTRSAGGG